MEVISDLIPAQSRANLDEAAQGNQSSSEYLKV